MNRPTEIRCALCGGAVPVKAKGRVPHAHPFCVDVLNTLDQLERQTNVAMMAEGMAELQIATLRRAVASRLWSWVNAVFNPFKPNRKGERVLRRRQQEERVDDGDDGLRP